MPFNLLIFPLVGGYFFLTICYLTKFQQQRLDHQRLLFNSILAGILLLFISYVLFIPFKLLLPLTYGYITSKIPFRVPYAEVAILSLPLSILCTTIINIIYDRTVCLSIAIDKIGSDFEKIIKRGFTDGELISFTLKSGKVYVGIPLAIPEPSKFSYISILPIFSGFRNEQHEVIFTTEYMKVYDRQANNGDFLLVLSTSEIASANLFDIDVFENFKINSTM